MRRDEVLRPPRFLSAERDSYVSSVPREEGTRPDQASSHRTCRLTRLELLRNPALSLSWIAAYPPTAERSTMSSTIVTALPQRTRPGVAPSGWRAVDNCGSYNFLGNNGSLGRPETTTKTREKNAITRRTHTAATPTVRLVDAPRPRMLLSLTCWGRRVASARVGTMAQRSQSAHPPRLRRSDVQPS